MTMSVTEVLAGLDNLASLPATYSRVSAMVDDPQCSVEDIGRVIAQDTALTARLLRIANSSFYGLPAKVDTVARAVTVLGTRQVRDLILATSAIHAFDGIPNDLVSMQRFWEHSIYCALAARALGMECIKGQRETLFVAGILHDVGTLVLYYRLPELSRQVLEAALGGAEGLESQEAERELMGLDHAEVGGELLRMWGLPAVLCECVAFHHDPGGARQFPLEAAVLHIANSIATLAELDSLDLTKAPRIQPRAWEATGLNEDVLEPVLRGIQAQISSARALLVDTKKLTPATAVPGVSP